MNPIDTMHALRRRKRGKKILVTSTAALLLSAVFAAPAQADYDSAGLGFTNINLQNIGGNSYWNSALERSAQNWNASGAGTSIRRTVGYGGRYEPGRYNNTWLGKYTASGTKCVNRTILIQINATAIENYTTSNNWDTVNVGTTTHEIGHGLSINDVTRPGVPSLMDSARDRVRIYTPQAWDVSEVKKYNPAC